MKNFSEMTDEEVVDYFVKRRQDGIPTRDLINSLYKLDFTPEQQRLVLDCLKKEDKKIKKQKEAEGLVSKRNSSIMRIVGGIVLFLLSIILFEETLKAGRIAILNIIMFGAALFLFLTGIVGLISWIRKR